MAPVRLLALLFLLVALPDLAATGVSACRADVPMPSVPLNREALVGRYDLDFRQGRYDYGGLRIEGSGIAVSLIKPSNEGLRVRVPPRTEGAGISLCTKFGIRGDFEAIVGYEVLDAPRPRRGPGIGPEISLQSAANWGDHVALSRRVAAGTGDASFAYAIERANATSLVDASWAARSSGRVGRLYLARSGATVYLYVAEGGGPYREISRAEFGTEDLLFVRLMTLFEGADRGLDLLWTDLSIRAEALPRDVGHPNNRGGSRRWLVLIVGILLGAFALEVARRRSQQV